MVWRSARDQAEAFTQRASILLTLSIVVVPAWAEPLQIHGTTASRFVRRRRMRAAGNASVSKPVNFDLKRQLMKKPPGLYTVRFLSRLPGQPRFCRAYINGETPI